MVVRHKRHRWTTEAVVYALLAVVAVILLVVGEVLT